MTAEQLAALVAFIRAEIAVEDLCVAFELGCENGVPVERQEPEPYEEVDMRAPYIAMPHPQVGHCFAVHSPTEGYLLNYRKVHCPSSHRRRTVAEVRIFVGRRSAEHMAHQMNQKKGLVE